MFPREATDKNLDENAASGVSGRLRRQGTASCHTFWIQGGKRRTLSDLALLQLVEAVEAPAPPRSGGGLESQSRSSYPARPSLVGVYPPIAGPVTVWDSDGDRKPIEAPGRCCWRPVCCSLPRETRFDAAPVLQTPRVFLVIVGRYPTEIFTT